VIIYNIATHRAGVFPVMVGMIIIMGILLILSRLVSKDPVQNLCFSYLNIGWLGLPVVIALFDDDAVTVIIAAYVGNSLFGNLVGVGMLSQKQNVSNRMRQMLLTPPIWALLIGLISIPFVLQLEQAAKPAYDVVKFLMSFLGMAVLGIWLSCTSLRATDFKQALLLFFARAITVFLLVKLFIIICGYYEIALVTQNQPTLYLLGLLPPAVNIIVLETHYIKNGQSASLVACGTFLSIIAIGLYVVAILWLRS
jgi:predicted permease